MKQNLSRSVAFVLTFVMALSLLAVTPIFGDVPAGPEHSAPLIRLTATRVANWESPAGGHRVDVRMYLDYNPNPGIFSLPGFLMPGHHNAAGEFVWTRPVRVGDGYPTSRVTLETAAGFVAGAPAALFTAPSIVTGRCWQRAVWQTNNTTNPFEVYFMNAEGDEERVPTTGFLARFRYYVPAGVDHVVFRYGPNPALLEGDISPLIRFGNGGRTSVEFDWHFDVVYVVEGVVPPTRHTVTFDTVGNGAVAPATIDVEDGATLTEAQLPVATPGTGYRFDGWSPDPLTTPITAATTFTATFVPDDGPQPENHLVTFSVEGNGTVAEATREVAAGTTLTLADMPAATPATGYAFSGWSPDPTATPITAPVTFTATFTPEGVQPPVYHTVRFDIVGDGSVDDDSPLTVLAGTTLTLADLPTPTPAAGHEFVNWTPDPTAAPITGDVTFTANFRLLPVGPRVIGDVNGDGVIDATDLMYIRTHITFPAANFLDGMNAIFFADINGDGVVTAADLQILRTYIYSGGTMRHRNIGQTERVPAP